VAIGAAFALVGAATLVGILYPGDNPPLQRTSSDKVVQLPGGQWRSMSFAGVASGSTTLMFNWTASAPVNLSWFQAYACTPAPGTCVTLPPLATWTDNASGHWTASGNAVALYEFSVEAVGGPGVLVNFSATFTEQYHAGQLALPVLPFAFTMVCASLLTGVGAVVLYLGLFLPSGVYGPLDDELPGEDGSPGSEEYPGPVGPNLPR